MSIPANKVSRWDQEVDVAVVGTGGGALAAAILAHDKGARVLLLEKSEKVGGTTAISGGGVWIPLNPHMKDLGLADSREEALMYCKLLTDGKAPDELVETYVDRGVEMIRYLEKHTPLKMRSTHMPDYQAEKPGGKLGGRCLEAELFATKELGEWESKLRRGPTMPIPMGIEESFTRWRAMVSPKDIDMELIAERMDQGLVSSGNALMGRMLKGCLDRNIPILLETPARELVMDDGQVAGLRAERDGHDYFIGTKAVILACGGFEWNRRLLQQFFPGPIGSTCSPPHCNEGDGLIMAMDVGADLANMSEGWFSPGNTIPGQEYEGEPMWVHAFGERGLPHSIMVNRHGRRFCDESVNYNDIGQAFRVFDPHNYEYPNSPAFLIVDSQFREKYSFFGVMPGDPDPEWLPKEETLATLGSRMGIDPQALQASVDRWNGFVRQGKDEDFGRGESPIGAYYGGDLKMPNPNMGTIEKGPFYAYEVVLGFMGGTNGGPRTNSNAQVLNVRGDPIPGLYAVGNTQASVCGPSYWGGGATIGQSMIFGYLAGIHAAEQVKARR